MIDIPAGTPYHLAIKILLANLHVPETELVTSPLRYHDVCLLHAAADLAEACGIEARQRQPEDVPSRLDGHAEWPKNDVMSKGMPTHD